MSRWILFLAGGMLSAAATSAADVVVIVHPSAVSPTKEQLADVYLGRSRSYTPVDQVESSPVRAEFYRKATGRDASQIKMVWARLVFTGKGAPPPELRGAAAVKQAVAADPRAVGYIDEADLDASVKRVRAFD
jgi:hypothetical protein